MIVSPFLCHSEQSGESRYIFEDSLDPSLSFRMTLIRPSGSNA
jgi:hypothetical protein